MTLPLALGVRIVDGGRGLHYAHTRTSFTGQPLCIVHRDVSPVNLIVTYEGGVKVVDFGIAKVASDSTGSGKLKGKIRYMAPEQALADNVDHRADIFSLGMVLFELATNTRMFPGSEDLELLRQVVSKEPLVRARERSPSVPEALDAIIAKALDRDPAKRFSSAQQMQEALEVYLQKDNSRVGSPEISRYMKSLFQSRMTERRKLIESAMVGEVNPMVLSATFKTKVSGVSTAAEHPHRRRQWLLAGGAAAGLVALISGAALTARAPAPEVQVERAAPARPTTLEVDSVPTGADVFLDGQRLGIAPFKIEQLEPGPHHLRANLKQYEPVSREVTVDRGEHLQLVLTLTPERVLPAAPHAASATPSAPTAPPAVPKRKAPSKTGTVVSAQSIAGRLAAVEQQLAASESRRGPDRVLRQFLADVRAEAARADTDNARRQVWEQLDELERQLNP